VFFQHRDSSSAASAGAAGTCTSRPVRRYRSRLLVTTGGESSGFNAIINKFNCDNPTYFVSNSAIAGGAGSVAQAALQNRVLAVPRLTPSRSTWAMSSSTRTSPRATWTIWTTCTGPTLDHQFPKGVLDIVSAKDSSGATHYYSVPLDIHRANVLWFNKTVFSSNNMTAQDWASS